MTAKKIPRKSVDRLRFKEFLTVAGQNMEAAADNMKSDLWTPAGILIVHSSIAYTDALTIKAAGVRSSGEHHAMAVDLVAQVLELKREDQNALAHFRRIIGEKARVAYGGKAYPESRVRQMWTNLERYRKWVEEKLEQLQ